MTRLIAWLNIGLFVLGPSVATAADPGHEVGMHRWVRVSTGLRSIHQGKIYRLNVVETHREQGRVVRLRIVSDRGNVIRELEGRVTKEDPLSLEIPQRDLPRSERYPQFVLAEYDILCGESPDDKGVITTAELIDDFSHAIDDASSCGCPCCGPPVAAGVAYSCGGMAVGDFVAETRP